MFNIFGKQQKQIDEWLEIYKKLVSEYQHFVFCNKLEQARQLEPEIHRVHDLLKTLLSKLKTH